MWTAFAIVIGALLVAFFVWAYKVLKSTDIWP